MNFKDTIIDNQKRHVAFRDFYWRNQTRYISYMAVGAMILCAAAIAIMVPSWHRDDMLVSDIKYLYALIVNIIVFAWARFLLVTNKLSDERKSKISEYLSLFVGINYLCFSVVSMDITFHESQSIDQIPYFIALSIITAFFLFPGYHYFAMVLLSVIWFGSVLVAHRYWLRPSTLVETTLELVLLFRLGQIRYIFSRNNFETDKKNRELIEETEASNEELLAINAELTETTEQLGCALEKVQAAADYQKAFSANLSHDMRAPLNGIIGTVQVMLMNDNLSDEQKEDLEICMTSGKTLLSLVNDVLDYSKIEAGQMEIIPADFDLHDVINAVNGMFKVQAEKKGLVFFLNVPETTPCSLYADDFRIQQVMTNIVSNAVKYTEYGNVEFKVWVEGDNLIFSVSDTGQGMSKESLKDLFVPFKRINEKNNKKIQGTGLGMAIVHSTVEQMKGTIDVVSAEGEGTTFTVTIPVVVRDRNNVWAAKNTSKKIEKLQTVHLDGKHILYIDDTAVNLKIVSKMLKDTGAKIDITSKPADGLNLLETGRYDLLLVDHLMPEIDGEEVLMRLRASTTENKDIPAIILTGNAGAGIDEHYRNLGFAGYLTKPIMRGDLLTLVKESLNE